MLIVFLDCMKEMPIVVIMLSLTNARSRPKQSFIQSTDQDA